MNTDTLSAGARTTIGNKRNLIDNKEKIDDYFDDFIFNFAQIPDLQLQRIAFPLPYQEKENLRNIEKEAWVHDNLFVDDGYYTIMLDKEEDFELPGDTTLSTVQVEWIYPKEKEVKKYRFEKTAGKWMLTGIELNPFGEINSNSFLLFFQRFASDSIFQLAHIDKPLIFVTTDPDDDFSEIETTIDDKQWKAFRPELFQDRFTNLIYGQPSDKESYTKIVQVKGIGNGFVNNLFFRCKNNKWRLYKYEDTSN